MVKINHKLVLLYISLLKQKAYCNINSIVYCKDNIHITNISSDLDLKIDEINEVSQITRHALDKNIIYDIEKIRYYIQNSCNIYIASHENKPVGRYVITDISNFKPSQYLNHSIFNKCTHYIFFCRTYEPYTGKNIYKYVLSKISQIGLKNNAKIFISCDINNIASQRGIISAGFRKMGVLRYVSLFGIELYSKLLSDGMSYDC